MRDIERLLALQDGYILRMHRSVILCTVLAYLSKDFECRVFIWGYDNFGECSCFLPHSDLETCHNSGFDIETLGVIAYGGEDELGFLGHIDAQHVRAVFVRGRAYLRAAKTDVHIRYGFTRILVDNLADDNRLDGMKE